MSRKISQLLLVDIVGLWYLEEQNNLTPSRRKQRFINFTASNSTGYRVIYLLTLHGGVTGSLISFGQT